MAKDLTPRSLSEGWENEGGSLRAAPAADGSTITRVLVETFKVGGYTYTNLPDAEAQARRLRKPAAGL
jgi:hypothetical protein